MVIIAQYNTFELNQKMYSNSLVRAILLRVTGKLSSDNNFYLYFSYGGHFVISLKARSVTSILEPC